MTERAREPLALAVEPPSGRDRWWSETRREVWQRAASHGVFGFLPLLVTAFILAIALSHHNFAVDFKSAFWPAGGRVLAGLTPYATPGSAAATHGFAFVYPAPGALLFAGFAWIPSGLAGALFTVLCVACALGVLAVLRVRDWRLYGLTLLWPAVISGWQTANLSLPLALGTALAWRFRNRPVVAGVTVGLIVSVKVFLWPLCLWLVLARRIRAFGWMLLTTLTVNGLAWAVVGFDQLSPYLRLVSAATRIEEKAAYTPLALALRLGAGRPLADAVAVVLIALCVWLCIACARERRESALLLGALSLSLLATPVVWIHYFALLLVPLAIMRPRLSAAWLLPLALFACPVTSPTLWQLVLTLGVLAVLVAVLLSRPVPAAVRPRRAPGVALGQQIVVTAGGGDGSHVGLRTPHPDPVSLQ